MTIDLRAFRDIIYIGLILLMGLALTRTCARKAEIQTTISGLENNLTKFRNELGQEIAKNNMMQGTVEEVMHLGAQLAAQDSLLYNMTKDLDRLTKAATAAKTVTTIENVTNTTILAGDTIIKGDTIQIYPVYYAADTNKWFDYRLRSDKDTTLLSLKVRNEYTSWQTYERQGLFKPKKAVVHWKNLNPYTETTELRSFTVSVKKPRRLAWLIGGFVAGFVGGLVFR